MSSSARLSSKEDLNIIRIKQSLLENIIVIVQSYLSVRGQESVLKITGLCKMDAYINT